MPHQRNAALAETGREEIFVSDAMLGYGSAATWAARTNLDPGSVTGALRSAIKSVNPHLSMNRIATMDSIVLKAQSGTRFSLLLIGLFAAIAALLAGVGLYGVLATVVKQRTAEIGVRMALGAAPGNIFGLVVGHGMRLSSIGIVVGVLAAFAVTRVMTSMLIGVEAADPLTYFGMMGVFLVIAAASCWIPAHRAASLDPNVALREE
jgi:ABC-type antimicrobial peptide transport system permease subunit